MSKPAKTKRIYRADRRNTIFGRKPVGNTTPLERQAIFEVEREKREERRREQQMQVAKNARGK